MTTALFSRCCRVAAFLLVGLLAVPAAAEDFPKVKGLEDNVEFWKKVYAVWSVNDIAFHDPSDFSLVYRVIRVPGKGKTENGVTRRQAINAGRKELNAALRSLHKKQPKTDKGLNDVEKEVFNNLSKVKRKDKYNRASSIRVQNGLREKFVKGYIAAGAWEADVKARLKRAGLPEDIVALAYVESLMDLRARSHAGAVGPWQFMRPTAKEYMQVHLVLDERFDPIIATDAAAQYLNTAKKNVGPWPVAITSYNYGRAGMRRGIKAAGTTDFATILAKFKSSRFGFAARNYYASFLAVHDVLAHQDAYFKDIQRETAWSFDVVRLPFPVLAPQLDKSGALTTEHLEYYNPSLTPEALAGQVVLPYGLPLRVPAGSRDAFYMTVLGFSADERKKAEYHVRTWAKANGRQTIEQIARLHGVSGAKVAKMNRTKPEAKPAKGTKVSIPSVPVKYSLFPEAVNVGIPPAPPLAALPGQTSSKVRAGR